MSTTTAGIDEVATPRKLPVVLAVASGKGGVGKTSIAVNLAIALARGGERVCILDADTGLANVNILLGLQPRLTLEHVLFGTQVLDDIILDAPGGIQVIPGANGISDCVTLQPRQQQRLVRELARVESSFDYLLIDNAAGIAEGTLDFIAAAQAALIVITPEPTSLTDAFSLIKLMARRRPGLRYQVIVNMCRNIAVGREVYQRFSTAVSRYIGIETRSLGFLPQDESLRNAVTLQQPVALFPETDPSSRAFLRLAAAVRTSIDEEWPLSSFADFWQGQFRRRQSAPATAREQVQHKRVSQLSPSRRLAANLIEAVRGDAIEPGQLAELLQRAVALFVERHGYSPLTAAEPSIALPANARIPATIASPAADAGRLPLRDEPGSPGLVVCDDEPPARTRTAVPAVIEQAPAHHYDASRFGPQEILLQRLRTLPGDDCSLAELLGQWRRTGG